MKKQSLKKLPVAMVCAACLLPMAAVPAAAAETEASPYIWEDFAEEEADMVEDVVTPRARGNMFNRGYIQLNNSDGKATIYGETLAYYVVDEIQLELYLEKYNGSTYDSYASWSYVGYNVSDVSKGFTLSVPKGYYYRLRGYHLVRDNGAAEAGSTETSGLKIQ